MVQDRYRVVANNHPPDERFLLFGYWARLRVVYLSTMAYPPAARCGAEGVGPPPALIGHPPLIPSFASLVGPPKEHIAVNTRTIKRYSNRKLYDTEKKRYITLEGIAELIREGFDVTVIENDSGEDLTAVTLSQIIFEQQKREPAGASGFFTHLIRFGTTSPLDLLRRSIDRPTSAFAIVEREIERRLQEVAERGEMAEEQIRRLRTDLMGRFQEGTKGRRLETDEEIDIGPATQRDIEDLSARLDTLSAQLDELIRQESQITPPKPTRKRRTRATTESEKPPAEKPSSRRASSKS